MGSCSAGSADGGSGGGGGGDAAAAADAEGSKEEGEARTSSSWLFEKLKWAHLSPPRQQRSLIIRFSLTH